jgi:hypothetical protein
MFRQRESSWCLNAAKGALHMPSEPAQNRCVISLGSVDSLAAGRPLAAGLALTAQRVQRATLCVPECAASTVVQQYLHLASMMPTMPRASAGRKPVLRFRHHNSNPVSGTPAPCHAADETLTLLFNPTACLLLM